MKVQIKNHFLDATFDTLGAELISLKSNRKEYIWEGNPEFWNRQSPVLFPIVGSLKDDFYFFGGKEYSLPRHGFAREKLFQIVEHTENKIIFSLKDDAESFKTYPFHFELQIEYCLIENRLEVRYQVKNNSKDNIYFSIGGHPGFALSGNFEDYSFNFECQDDLKFSLLENNLVMDETKILQTAQNKLALNYQLFEKDALVFKNHKIESITIQEFGKDFLKVSFKGFPDLGIWTKINAPFICIEPWFGHADRVNTNQELKDKEGIVNLKPNNLFQSLYTVEIFS